jgi:hypothetical protein
VTIIEILVNDGLDLHMERVKEMRAYIVPSLVKRYQWYYLRSLLENNFIKLMRRIYQISFLVSNHGIEAKLTVMVQFGDA